MLGALWGGIGAAFATEPTQSGAAVQEFLKRLNPAWNVVGRVHFHVADNRVTHAHCPVLVVHWDSYRDGLGRVRGSLIF